MGDIVTHLFDPRDQGLNAVEHLIERDGELIDFVASGFHRDPFSKFPSGYVLSRSADRLDTGKGPPGHEPTDPGSQNDQKGHRRNEYSLKCLDESGGVFHRLPQLQNDARTDNAVKDAHLVLAVRYDDRLEHLTATPEQPF